MSSDESTCTNVSTFSNRAATKPQLKAHNSEEWEINQIGDFLLDLYHRNIITPKDNWCIKKSEMREKFSQFVSTELKKKFKEVNGTDNIGTLLERCGFLINTLRGSLFYKIKSRTLFDFRNKKLKELDKFKMNNDGIKREIETNEVDNRLLENNPNTLEEDHLDIDENEPKIPLEYQGTSIRQRVTNYCPTNTSCYICQEDFSTMESFEEHIQIHGDETDFQFVSSLDKCDTPIFTINYTLCKNSHHFCFEFASCVKNLIIEKIIIVQSRSFFYVYNMRVPYKYPESGIDRFFVDSHLFTIHMEQPIIFVCHLEDSKDSRIIEQHHFMRSEEFPKVNFPISPNRLPNGRLFVPKFKLADYFPPKEIQDALKDDFYHENLMITSNEFRDYVRNEKKLQPQTIGASLNILLQIEDMDTIQEYFSLKQQNIKLRSFGDEYSFRLKPKQRIFLENLLSAYDEVILTTQTDIFTNKKEIMELMLQNKSDIKRMKNTFVGLIQSVNTARITFKCEQKIDIHASYTVICRPSRLNFRYQYRSLQLLSTNMDFLRKFLFPTKIPHMPLSTKSIILYNENINGEQLQAVRNIAEGPRNDATYVIFGPPGTGKTTTLVEGILQILKRPDTKILVTASSNSACDEIALRLCKYLKRLDIQRAMVRIYSRSSEIRTETIDDDLLECSNMYNGQFYPDIEILHQYHIVICTLSIVAKLATGKFGRKENGGALYTHLFIDEVAASTEVEALMAITTILTPQSCLIISGDHKQLGPILQSKRAKELGLAASLMDRLLARDCYRLDVDNGDYDRTIQTRLVRNYRSHPAIVNLYSGLYYNHSLEPYAKQDDVSLGEIWHQSRNKKYPILFHAIYEPSKSDKQSHSLYNPTELQVVMDYVKDLMYFGINGEPVKENDIGIISPYKKQYKRIQEELNLRKWFGIETGSVEIFQGKEKNIIIVSFVRSGTENLGFLDSPRRLNVTISRPKSLLILIGNPKTLSLNDDFEYIIKECRRNNTFVGANSPPRSDLRRQSAETPSKPKEMLSQLNKKIRALKVENAFQVKGSEISKTNRGPNRGAGRKQSRSKNKQTLNDISGIDKDGGKKNDDGDEEDESDDESQDTNQPNTSALPTKNSSGINNSNKDQEKVTEISQKKRRQRRRQERKNIRNKNNEKSDRMGIDKDVNNKEEEDDDDDDNDDESQDNSNDKSTTSALGKTINSKNNSKKGYDVRQSKTNAAAKGGKISKQHGKGRQKDVTNTNKNLHKIKLDSIFNELPQVPPTTSKLNHAIYTKEQLLQLQQQQNFYNNLPQYPPVNYNKPFLPTENAAFKQPIFNSFQQHQSYNCTPQLSSGLLTANNNGNLSCFKNNATKNSAFNSTSEARHTNRNAANSNSISLNKNNSRFRNNNTNSTKHNDRNNATAFNISKVNIGSDKNTTTAANANTTTKSTSIAKPFKSEVYENSRFSTKPDNESSEQQKNQYTSGAMNLVSNENFSNTSACNMNTNRRDDIPVATQHFRKLGSSPLPGIFSNTGGNNVISSGINDVRPSTPTAINNSSMQNNSFSHTSSVVTPKSSISTTNSSYTRSSIFPTNTSNNWNNNPSIRSSTGYNSNTINTQTYSNKNKKTDNSCTIS